MLGKGASLQPCDSPRPYLLVLVSSCFTTDQSVRLFCYFSKKKNLISLNGSLYAHRLFSIFPRWEIVRFYGFEENKREVEMDMREMVDKVKRKEPLYGTSSLSPYMQGVASRNSRYSGVWLHVIPWFNFVNHEQVCITVFI